MISKKTFLLKRIIDVVISGIGLILLFPIFVVIGALIKLDSKGPVFFVQERAGKDGKIFKTYKLRMMVSNVEKIGLGYEIKKDDERIARVGKHLSWGIDELSQLILTRRTEHHKLARGYLLLQNNLSL